MRLRGLLVIVVGALLLGCPVVGFGQTGRTGASEQTANDAPVGSEQNPVKVASGVMAGVINQHEWPHYPVYRCGDPAFMGTTVVRVIISPEGKVDKMTVITGPMGLRDANLQAVRQWTYKPYLLNGTAAWVQTTVTLYSHGACEPK